LLIKKALAFFISRKTTLQVVFLPKGKGFRNETFDFSIAEILGGWAQSANQRVSGRNLEFQLC